MLLKEILNPNHLLSLLFSHSVSSSSLLSHGMQHTRLPCLSLSPRVCSNSCPSSQWWTSNHLILYHPFLLLLCLSKHQGLFQWRMYLFYDTIDLKDPRFLESILLLWTRTSTNQLLHELIWKIAREGFPILGPWWFRGNNHLMPRALHVLLMLAVTCKVGIIISTLEMKTLGLGEIK